MSRTDYLGWVGTLALAAVLALLLLRPLAGERWFGLYGVASVAIPTAITAGVVLARRFSATGKSPWRSALLVVPVLLLAAVQIGYWTTFFSLGAQGVALALVRAVVLDAVGPWMPALGLALSLLLAWLLASAARFHPMDSTGEPRR